MFRLLFIFSLNDASSIELFDWIIFISNRSESVLKNAIKQYPIFILVKFIEKMINIWECKVFIEFTNYLLELFGFQTLLSVLEDSTD